MAETDFHITYDVEVITLYWAEKTSDLIPRLRWEPYWGTTYNWTDFENWFDDLANGGGLNQKTIIVAPSGATKTTYQEVISARFPACLNTCIGVTGVFDDNWANDSWCLKVGEIDTLKDNNGYGIDIAAPDNYTSLPWTIDIYYGIPLNFFAGTCNAAVFVAGIVAILKQTYDPLTIIQLQQTLQYTGDEEGDSPKNYGSEYGGSYETYNPYNESFYYGSYPGYYHIAWGIIDIYEAYLYLYDNIIP